MCGLVGLIARQQGGFNYSDLEVFQQMLILDTVRGRDSTGCFARFRNGDVRAIKHGSHPFNLFRTNEWKDFNQAVINRGTFVIGHNRKATIGQVNTDNAHPFVEDHIVLVHNGTLRSQDNLTKEDTDVDSHAIAHALAENDGDPRKVLDRIDGAFALIWYNSITDKLYAARNDERPLSMLVTDKFYALTSEPWIAGHPLERDGQKITECVNIKPNELFEFEGRNAPKVSEFHNEKPKWVNGHKHFLEYDYNDEGFVEDDGDAPFETGESETPDQKALRRHLTENANRKQQRLLSLQGKNESKQIATHSNVCALTQPNGTVGMVGPTAPESQRSINEETLDAGRMARITAQSDMFPTNLVLLCKVISHTVNNAGRIRWMGTCVTPGLEMVDVSGYLPPDVQPGPEASKYFQQLALAKVSHCTDTVNGGLTVHVKDTRLCMMISQHRGVMPLLYWDYAVTEGSCEDCNRHLFAWEAKFSSVKTKGLMNRTTSGKPLNVLSCKCPDCILKAIPKGPYHDSFEKEYKAAKAAVAVAYSKPEEKTDCSDANCNPPVQGGEQLRAFVSARDDEKLRVQGPKTVQ